MWNLNNPEVMNYVKQIILIGEYYGTLLKEREEYNKNNGER